MTTGRKIKEVFSWVFLILMLAVFIFTSFNVYNAKKTGDSFFLFGYRPIFVLTGSMEPYMMTNGLALTKEVTDLEELEVGDVVTYHADTESGRTLRITHRIVEISDGYIYTKGDNNNVVDGYPLTMENIEAKVIGVTNITAEAAAIWNNSTAGKIFLICFTTGVFLLIYSIKYLFMSMKDKRNKENEENLIEEKIEILRDTSEHSAEK